MSIASELAQLENFLKTTPDPQQFIGSDWYQLTDAESEVFGLSVDELPRLVAVHELYYAALELTTDIASDRVQSMRAELPWLPLKKVGVDEWQRFAILFGISHRQAHAFYAKQEFWQVRSGLVTYSDEK